MSDPAIKKDSDFPGSTARGSTIAAGPSGDAKIIVIGSGPVGMRFVESLLKRAPMAHVQLFGNEPYQPYNRVQLSALLAGEISRDALDIPLPSPCEKPNFSYTVSVIRKIDTSTKTVTDADGREHDFDILVIATGARAHVPSIPGVDRSGVYTFRNLKDTEFLSARVVRSRHIVVVGGGLLGLEAAKGLLRFNTRVTVIQQGPRLMNRQLSDEAASLLQAQVEALGIRVIVSAGVRKIQGDQSIQSVLTNDGDVIDCDTVLLCAGIIPNVELARAAGISAATGITVNDQLQTSHPDIYAIGECCQHRGLTYGLVTPGFEQATVAAEVICNGQAHYVGSQVASRLKVIGQSVFSIGQINDLPSRPLQREAVYRNKGQGIYRHIILHRGHIIGAVGMGEWPELNRVQEAFNTQRKVWFWQYWVFLLSGRLWPLDGAEAVGQWPATAIVCQCSSVTQGELINAISTGCTNQQQLQDCTNAGKVCGSCKPLLSELLSDSGLNEQLIPEKETGWGVLLAASIAALSTAVVVAAMPEAVNADSVQSIGWFERVWNDKFWKQVSGFSLLGLSLLGMLMSLRKRLNLSWMGQFANWRVFHGVLGLACAGVLILHTGFHLGSNLNRWLMVDFLGVLTIGAASGMVVALSHRLKPRRAISVRKTWSHLHVLMSWPLPALLIMHILSVYYF
jgi:nitrite reductase (NADH) large subunit